MLSVRVTSEILYYAFDKSNALCPKETTQYCSRPAFAVSAVAAEAGNDQFHQPLGILLYPCHLNYQEKFPAKTGTSILIKHQARSDV